MTTAPQIPIPYEESGYELPPVLTDVSYRDGGSNEHEHEDSSRFGGLVGLPRLVTGGMRRAVSALDGLAYMNATDRERGEAGLEPVNGNGDLLTVTSQPDPELADSRRLPRILLAFPGLVEMGDASSARRIHIALARTFPEDIIKTVATDGVSKNGKLLGLSEGWNNTFDRMARDRLDLASGCAGDSEVAIVATSMSVNTQFSLAKLNIDEDRINLERLFSISGALVGCGLNEERMQEVYDGMFGTDLSENEIRDIVLGRFFKDLAPEALSTLKREPVGSLGVLATGMAAYLLSPHKFPRRALAVAGNLRSATHGTDLEIIENVASQHPIGVLAGGDDSLHLSSLYDAIAQVPGSNVQSIIRPGEGHFMSVKALDAAGYIQELDHRLAA